MADSVTVTNFPDSGSRERVAYDLMMRIINKEERSDWSKNHVLETFADCLKIAQGYSAKDVLGRG